MAQDLSKTIQDGIAQTLTDLLGIDARFQETTLVDRRDIQSSQLLQVNAEFEFDKLSTIFKFMIPASTASIIFNTMMGATEYDISDAIDDDTTDAMGEFASNASGSLVTAFNALEEEELGKVKFHIQHKELLDGSSLGNIDTLYRFLIELDEKPLTLFINFDEHFLPFIEEISKTEPTPYPEEEEVKEEEEPEEENGSQEEAIEEETADPKSIITDEKSDSQEEAENEEEIESSDETPDKNKKLKLLIIGISSLIALILIIFLTLYFMSSDEELETQEEETEQIAQSKDAEKKPKQEEITITPNKTLKKIDFNIKDIDTTRLNGRLATLTKYEVLTKEELELQKKEEAQRLELLRKEEELKEFAKLNKEEPILIKSKPDTKKQEEQKPIIENKPVITKPTPKPVIKKDAMPEPKEMVVVSNEEESPVKIPEKVKVAKKEEPQLTPTPMEPQKLLYISTNSIKYRLFKTLILQANTQTARISMCNDKDGRTSIIIGPFEQVAQQTKMDQLIKDSKENIETSMEKLTSDEFNQRCSF